MTPIFQQDSFTLDAEKITEEKHPLYGDMTVFHRVVIASEIVQPYEDGLAWKPRDELESYAKTVDGRWVILGGHPEDGIISTWDQVSGRTVNPVYVKDLIDPKTKRPNRAGVRADVQIFHGKTTPQQLADMKSGKKQEVSIGFFYTKDETAGTVESDACKGEKYDYVQRNMFHDHLAAGIDNGRCPMPYCGLGADEIGKSLANDPFGGFSSFSQCVSKIMRENPDYTEEQAKATCRKLKSEYESNKKEDDALRKTLRELAQMMLDEMEELKGMKDAKKDEKEWYLLIPWKEEPYKVIFDSLNEETRILLTEKGLCPHCDSDEESEECEEGYEKNEAGECVPVEEEKMEEESEDTPLVEETPKEADSVKKLNPLEVLKRFDSVMSKP